jgi:hypothetical protein
MAVSADDNVRSVALAAAAIAVVAAFAIVSIGRLAMPYADEFSLIDLREKPIDITQDVFPDDALRAYVEDNLDTDQDGRLGRSERNAVTEIGSYDFNDRDYFEVYDEGISGLGITSLDGLEVFPNLQMVVAQDNDIEVLDVSKLTSLDYLDVRGNIDSEGDREFAINSLPANDGLQIVFDQGFNPSGDTSRLNPVEPRKADE